MADSFVFHLYLEEWKEMKGASKFIEIVTGKVHDYLEIFDSEEPMSDLRDGHARK